MSGAVCPCGIVVHPWVIFNRPGQATLAYRAGDYAAFRHALLRALPGETELSQTVGGQTVQVWRPGAEGDLGVQIMEWWAYLADVLTFYNERIANQAYLGTADLPESVNRLIQVLGYRPRPGIGAAGMLACVLSTNNPVLLPAGFQVQSKPGPGQQPQIFELGADTVLQRPDVVAARPVPAAAPLLSADGTTVWLAGQAGGIKPTDRLLLINADALTGGGVTAFAWLTVQSVQSVADPYGDKATAVRFTAPVAGLSGAVAADFVLLRSGRSALPWSLGAAGRPSGVIDPSSIDLASIVRDLEPGSLAMFDVAGVPSDAAVQPEAVVITGNSESIWYANGNGPHPPTGSPPPVPIPIPHTQVTFAPALAGSWDANAALVTLRFGWTAVGTLVPVLTPAQAAFTGATTALRAATPFPIGVDQPILLQDANGNGASAVGTVGTDPAIMTLGSVAGLPDTGAGPTLDVLFDLFPVTRGKSVANEVLGSGNAAVAGQDFMLKKAPVTYVRDPASRSGEGFSSTVRAWVNGIEWQEVPSFYGQAANATVFVTREDEQGNTHVTFGDGTNGAALPTGVNNVVASYRTGSGSAAPAPGSLTNILQPQPGLRSLANPVAPTGGADPDPPSRIRSLAPRSVLTFGRAISLDDYQAIAASTPGVVQAAAGFGFDPMTQRPSLTIWVSGDNGAVANVQATIAAEADPNRPVTVLRASAVPTTIHVGYARDPRYLDQPVQDALHAALLDPDTGLFGVNAVGIGQAFFDSQIYAACLAVPGVTAVESLTVRVGRFFPLIARIVRRGRIPIGGALPCSGERYDPGQGSYISVPDDGAHLVLNGTPAS